MQTKLNILFWNIGKKDLSTLIVDYCDKYNVDVLVLIEDMIPPSKMLLSLNNSTSKYSFCSTNTRGISIYTSFTNSFFKVLKTSSNFISVIEIALPSVKRITIGAVHLSSKLTAKTDSARHSIAREINSEVNKIEKKYLNQNTVVLGDFNMHPFEYGMVSHESFNAVMCRKIASSGMRKISGYGIGTSKMVSYFYNPMWSFLGDLSKFSPGTYYWHADEIDNNYRWNTLDQILFRPNLIPNFDSDSLEIIEKDISGKSLINTKSKHLSKICDHLPIFFTLDLLK